MSNIREEIYKIVSKIPRGKVVTYGQITEVIQNSKIKVQNYNSKFKITPRLVGIALHNNPDPVNIPCHRVVNKNGRIAQNYAFGGWKKQREKLINEGVKFKNALFVNLEFCNWDFSSLERKLCLFRN